MLTYSIMVGNRQNQEDQIPIVLIPYLESNEEADVVQRMFYSSSSNHYFGSGKVQARNDYIHLYTSLPKMTRDIRYIASEFFINEISCEEASDGRSSIMVPAKYIPVMKRYIDILKRHPRKAFTINGNRHETDVINDSTISPFFSGRWCSLIKNTEVMHQPKEVGTSVLTGCDMYFGLSVPNYEESIIEELVSLLAICVGEPMRKGYMEEVEAAITKLSHMVYNPDNRQYIPASVAATELRPATECHEYAKLLSYREKYIRCRQ